MQCPSFLFSWWHRLLWRATSLFFFFHQLIQTVFWGFFGACQMNERSLSNFCPCPQFLRRSPLIGSVAGPFRSLCPSVRPNDSSSLVGAERSLLRLNGRRMVWRFVDWPWTACFVSSAIPFSPDSFVRFCQRHVTELFCCCCLAFTCSFVSFISSQFMIKWAFSEIYLLLTFVIPLFSYLFMVSSCVLVRIFSFFL